MERINDIVIRMENFGNKKDRLFLAQIDKDGKMTEGKWSKLYAMLANARNSSGINYRIFEGQWHEFHVNARTIVPVMHDDRMSIGSMLEGKK